jgi:hypothetical protein
VQVAQGALGGDDLPTEACPTCQGRGWLVTANGAPPPTVVGAPAEAEGTPPHCQHTGEREVERERDELRAEVEKQTRLANVAAERMRTAEYREDLLKQDVERLQGQLARWKPANCGKIFPVPVPGEAVEYCVREVDHGGPHQAETGKVWVFPPSWET